MVVVDHRTVPEIVMRPGIRGQFLANHELGARGVSLLANAVDPGAAVPLHKHTVEETMLVLEGTVWIQVSDERQTVGPQCTVIIPADTPHAWGNSGPGVARLLWAFAGSDPFGDATYLEGQPPAVPTRSASSGPRPSRRGKRKSTRRARAPRSRR